MKSFTIFEHINEDMKESEVQRDELAPNNHEKENFETSKNTSNSIYQFLI
jgi:hypothetical protein